MLAFAKINIVLSFISAVCSSSWLTLKIFEKHEVRKNNLLATFVIPYGTLLSSRNGLLFSRLLSFRSIDFHDKNFSIC